MRAFLSHTRVQYVLWSFVSCFAWDVLTPSPAFLRTHRYNASMILRTARFSCVLFAEICRKLVRYKCYGAPWGMPYGKRYARKLTGMSNVHGWCVTHSWFAILIFLPNTTGQWLHPSHGTRESGLGWRGKGRGRRKEDEGTPPSLPFPRNLPSEAFCLTQVLVPNDFCPKRRWTPALLGSSHPSRNFCL